MCIKVQGEGGEDECICIKRKMIDRDDDDVPSDPQSYQEEVVPDVYPKKVYISVYRSLVYHERLTIMPLGFVLIERRIPLLTELLSMVPYSS